MRGAEILTFLIFPTFLTLLIFSFEKNIYL